MSNFTPIKEVLQPRLKYNNVNDNVDLQSKSNNDNVNDRSRSVDFIADKLTKEFNNPNYREFYCKVAWKLSEAQIQKHLESAKKGKNPPALFSWLCKRDMV